MLATPSSPYVVDRAALFFVLATCVQVIDEADRLLAQSFQDWLAQVLAATRSPPVPVFAAPLTASEDIEIPYPDGLSPAFLHLFRPSAAIATPTLPSLGSESPFGPVITDIDTPRESSCQKLLFSATLMSDPGKIKALELRDARYIVVQGRAKARNGEVEVRDKDEVMDDEGRVEGEGEGVLDVVMERFSMPATLRVRFFLLPPSNASRKNKADREIWLVVCSRWRNRNICS